MNEEQDFHVSVVALEILNQAVWDFSVRDGWSDYPELSEDNYARVGSRLRDFLAYLAQHHDVPDPAVWPEAWHKLQLYSQKALGEPND